MKHFFLIIALLTSVPSFATTWVRGSSHENKKGSPAGGLLVHHGGPVIQNIKVDAVMWGPTVDSVTQSDIGGMISATLNSSYFDLLTQYSTSSQKIGQGTFEKTIVIVPENQKLDVTDREVALEIEHQVKIGVLSKPDENTVYSVFFPKGITVILNSQGMYPARTCEQVCGFHWAYRSKDYGPIIYTAIPDLSGTCSLGCGGTRRTFDSVTTVESHELAETITNPASELTKPEPELLSWTDIDGHQEIGDFCNLEMTQLKLQNGTTYTVQDLYSNAEKGCTTATFESPVHPELLSRATPMPWPMSTPGPQPRVSISDAIQILPRIEDQKPSFTFFYSALTDNIGSFHFTLSVERTALGNPAELKEVSMALYDMKMETLVTPFKTALYYENPNYLFFSMSQNLDLSKRMESLRSLVLLFSVNPKAGQSIHPVTHYLHLVEYCNSNPDRFLNLYYDPSPKPGCF